MDYAVKFLAFIFAYKSYLSFKMYSFLGIFHNRLRKDKPEVVLWCWTTEWLEAQQQLTQQSKKVEAGL